MATTTTRALLSVSDKTGLTEFAQRLTGLGVHLVSTGGTLRHLSNAGIDVTPVSELTDFPEIFGGRVKTLHPAIHGGILFRRGDADDERVRKKLGIAPIDLVVVNLYPFEATVAHSDVALSDAVEQIDIGGPTLIRAAAKNFEHVTVVVSPSDYGRVAEALEARDAAGLSGLRRHLALAAFRHTAAYDAAISHHFADFDLAEAPFAAGTTLALGSPRPLRYGENPHQAAAVFASPDFPYLGQGESVQGKPLSYNNLLDLTAALQTVAELEQPAAVIVKHSNPCGVGLSKTGPLEAYQRALAGDPQSAFGGIVAFNRTCDANLAELLVDRFFEVVAAPELTPDARRVFKQKKNLRVIRILPRRSVERSGFELRSTPLGVLAQQRDPIVRVEDEAVWRVATRRQPADDDMTALRFLWRVVKHVKSNAICVGSAERTYGIGAGQMSRVDAVRLALSKRGDGVEAACLASDAFFPFRDNIDVAAAGGIRAIIQPGGSRRDDEVIDACDEHGLVMVMTGHRHFKH